MSSEHSVSELDEMGNLSIALPPEAWRAIFLPMTTKPLSAALVARNQTHDAIKAALVRAGYWS